MSGHPLTAIARKFPPMRFALAYGSAVFAQPGNIPSMTDLIFAVDNPVDWHTKNLEKHSHHYSFLQYFGAKGISNVQSWGGGMYFNPDVEIDNRAYKYGVISVADLLEDLQCWSYMYVSGRLQKPIRVLVHENSDGGKISSALEQNLRSAVAVALLRLPPFFEESELYHEIASLSYGGDLRMAIKAEDPNKAQKIVLGSLEEFTKYYDHVLSSPPFGSIVNRSASSPWKQDIGVDSSNALIALLPKAIRASKTPILEMKEAEVSSIGVKSARQLREEAVRKQLHSIIWRSSTIQTAKGLLTGGVSRSFEYSLRKLKIGWTGKK